VLVAARLLVRRRDAVPRDSRRDVLPERARLVVRVPPVVRVRVPVEARLRVPVDARLRAPAVLRVLLRAVLPVVRRDVVRPRVVLRERVLEPLRLRVPPEDRCVAWPSSPCCFMTVRAATSFARLP
jgi:hypothetical protein